MVFSIVSTAPGRICLYGDHQDYLLNPVIACAINRSIEVRATAREGCGDGAVQLHVHKPDLGESSTTITFDEHGAADDDNNGGGGSSGSLDFLRLALTVLRRYKCVPLRSYDVAIRGTLPINAGLSSSSALTAAFIHFLVAAFGVECPNPHSSGGDAVFRAAPVSLAESGAAAEEVEVLPLPLLARLTWETEVLELGTAGGKMDHYSLCLGAGILLHTRSDTWQRFTTRSLPLRLVLAVSGQRKDTNGTLSHLKTLQMEALAALQAKRPLFDATALAADPALTADCRGWAADPKSTIGPLVHELADKPQLQPYLRAALLNHVITASAALLLLPSVQSTASGVEGAHGVDDDAVVQGLGVLMNLHHASLRDDLRNSTDLIERIVAAASTAGAAGAKIVGSGGGGCVVAIATSDVGAQAVAAAMKEAGAVESFVVQESSTGPQVMIQNVAV